MGWREEVALGTQWLREPDAWDEAYVIDAYGRRFVFHLVALRSHDMTWCGYLGYRADLPITDDGYRTVEACAHRGECTGSFGLRGDVEDPTKAPGTLRIPWPGYVYPGFDCNHIGDWSPRTARTNVSPSDYRTLEYVQRCLRAMADAFVAQMDPALVEMLGRADAEAEDEEAADCAVGPGAIL